MSRPPQGRPADRRARRSDPRPASSRPSGRPSRAARSAPPPPPARTRRAGRTRPRLVAVLAVALVGLRDPARARRAAADRPRRPRSARRRAPAGPLDHPARSAARSSTATATSWPFHAADDDLGRPPADHRPGRRPPTPSPRCCDLTPEQTDRARRAGSAPDVDQREFAYVARQVDDAAAEQVRALDLKGISDYPESQALPAQRGPGPQHAREHRPRRQRHRRARAGSTTRC